MEKAIRLLSPECSSIQTPSGYMNVALTATKYIHANYPDEINLEEIATLLNVTSRKPRQTSLSESADKTF